MVNQRRDSNGNFDIEYSKDIFLDLLEESPVPITTTEIADKVGCSRRRAHERLQELEREGEIYSNLAGNEREWSSGPSPQFEERTLADYAAANLSEIPSKNTDGMVIAIQQPHSRDILSGRKPIEFRKGAIKESNCPDIAFLYEPSPTKAIIGVFEIQSVERRPVDELIEIGVERTPSTKESLENYFASSEMGTAIHISDAKPVDPPISLNSGQDGGWLFTPPQSFYYVDPEEFISSFPQMKDESPPSKSQQSGSPSKTS